MDANIERFQTETKPFVNDWKSIDLRVIASRPADKWVHGAIRIILDSSSPSTPTRQDLPSIDGLLVTHERWSINMLDDLLGSLSAGELSVGGKDIVVKNLNANPQISYSFQRMTRQDSQRRLAASSYSLYLQSWGGEQINEKDIERIDSSLRSNTYPWDGIADLLRNFLNISPNFVSTRPSKLVEVIAPIALRIVGASFAQENRIDVAVEVAPSLSIEKIALSAI